VRSVENALGMEIPLNAQYIRNIMMGAHATHDHIVHLYHLTALDWVDLVSAVTKGDPKGAAALGAKISPWPHNTVAEIKASQDRLAAFVKSGQLGIYGSGYWGHPAMKLAPDVNLLAAHHYLQALHYQRRINMIVSILGSKTPHVQTLTVGGVTNPINPDAPDVLNMERLYYVKTLLDEAKDFVHQVMIPDTCAIAAMYADWTGHGKGVTNYLAVPDMPMDTKGTKFFLPGGYIPGGDLSKFMPITSYQDPNFRDNVAESIKHSWYDGDWNKHPWDEETVPKYSDWKDSVTESAGGKYSWVKSPTFKGQPAQVGPLANVLCMVAAGHEGAKKYVGAVLDTVSSLAGTKVGVGALHSTIGRIGARTIRCAILNDSLQAQFAALMENIGKGDVTTFNQPVFPKGEQKGFGFHEAPRGTLSHWIVIQDGQIKNYQGVVPGTWNSCPRNGQEAPGPYEAALVGTPIADPDRPLEVIRTIHSFDPCLACAIHIVDKKRNKTIKVRAL
jgi:hydrogenase large subunit